MPNDIHSPGYADLSPAERAVVGALDRAAAMPAPPDDKALAYHRKNDLGNAKRLIARHGDGLRWCDEVGWVAWDALAGRWRIEDGPALAVMRAHETSESMFDEREAVEEDGQRDGETAEEFEDRLRKLAAWGVSSGNRSRAEGMLISAAPYLRAKLETFDADPWALNVANGVLRLNEPRVAGVDTCAALYPHDAGARMTKQGATRFDPAAECPKWQAFIDQVFEGRPDVARYVQKVLGYCLTGDISEQKMWFFFGAGRNGKSTIVQVVARVIGDYAALTPVETFLHREHKSGSGPSPDIARLPGVRLLRTSEPEIGSRLAESIVKQISSGEPLAARHLNKGFFEFRPACKVIFSTNHKPTIVGKDEGIRRRIVIVPFERQFQVGARRGVTLEDELVGEASGILNWLLEGLTAWWQEGLAMPETVAAATKAYFDEMDPIGSFLADSCKRVPQCGPEAREMATVLFQAYKNWCEANNETAREQTAFGRRLGDLGHTTKKLAGLVYRVGLELLPEARPITHTRGED